MSQNPLSLLSRARSRTGSAVSSRLGLLQITLAAILWGTSGVVAQIVHRSTGMSPMTISFWRLAVSAAAMLLIALPRIRSISRAVRRHPWGLVLAGLGLASYQALYFISVTTAGVNVATMISLGVAPIITAGWEAISHRRWPALRQLITITAAVLGLVLIAGGQGQVAAGPHPAVGVLAAIGSGAIYGASAVLGRHLAQDTSATAMTTLSSVVGALSLAPFAIFVGPAVIPARGATVSVGTAYLGLVFIGVVSTAVAYMLFNAGLRATASSAAAVLTLIEPLTAAVLAVAVLSEPLGWATSTGGALLIGAVAVLYLAPAPRGQHHPDQTADQEAISSPR